MLRIRNRHKSCEAAGQSRTAMTSSPRNLRCGRPPIKRGLTPGQPASIERPSTIGGEAQPLAGSGVGVDVVENTAHQSRIAVGEAGDGDRGGMTLLPHHPGSWADRDGLVLG